MVLNYEVMAWSESGRERGRGGRLFSIRRKRCICNSMYASLTKLKGKISTGRTMLENALHSVGGKEMIIC